MHDPPYPEEIIQRLRLGPLRVSVSEAAALPRIEEQRSMPSIPSWCRAHAMVGPSCSPSRRAVGVEMGLVSCRLAP